MAYGLRAHKVEFLSLGRTGAVRLVTVSTLHYSNSFSAAYWVQWLHFLMVLTYLAEARVRPFFSMGLNTKSGER